MSRPPTITLGPSRPIPRRRATAGTSLSNDGRRLLALWGDQAEALGWTARDRFGLHKPPAQPHPSYSRLSRYDETGLIWLLQGREVVALTEATATIQNPADVVTTYRRHNKPVLDLEPPVGGGAV